MARPLLRLLALLLVPAAAGAEPVASVFGGRIACAEVEPGGVQFCEGGMGARPESFDGVPLDVNVTLPPAAQDGPFPLIVDLHGFAGSKSGSPATARATAGLRGRLLLRARLRQLVRIAGLARRRRHPREPERLRGARLDPPRRRALRGARHAVPGRRARRRRAGDPDQGRRHGRVLRRRPVDDSRGAPEPRDAARRHATSPWQSPGGTPMEIAAAAPLIPWSDLAYVARAERAHARLRAPRTPTARAPA